MNNYKIIIRIKVSKNSDPKMGPATMNRIYKAVSNIKVVAWKPEIRNIRIEMNNLHRIGMIHLSKYVEKFHCLDFPDKT